MHSMRDFFIDALLQYCNITITMGATRTDLHPEKFNELGTALQALGHPARLRIIDILIKKKECMGHLLVDELGLAQPTVHQHLKRLKEAGLIQGNIDGNRVCYCIDADALNELRESLKVFLDRPIAQNCC